MTLRALVLVLALAAPASAQEAGETAGRAADMLAEAARTLEAAQEAQDRVAALTGVVRAYEEGLAALRDGLRQVAIRERALGAELAAREAEVARLLGVLAGLERVPEPLLMLHPSGALGSARAAMMLGDAAPALRAEAEVLRADLAALAELRAVEEAAAESLAQGLEGIQAARLALSQAIAARTDAPRRLAEDDARMAALLERIDTLEAFAADLARLPGDGATRPADPPWRLPVAGTVLRRPGEADAAGIRRPGLVLATAPGAPVTAPVEGTVRYAGPLLDYGLVIILEPRPGVLLVFAGADTLYVSRGDVVPAGAPLAAMGGAPRDDAAGAGASRPETLYVDVREAGGPADPSEWFALE